MSANFPPQRGRVLSIRERERRRRELQELNSRLRNEIVIPQDSQMRRLEQTPARTLGRLSQFIDPNVREDEHALQRRMRQIERSLKVAGPRELDKRERKRLEKQAAQDREWLRSQMVSKKLFYAKSSDPEFNKAVEACGREHDPRYKKVAERYKNNMRELAPNDERAANLESIRPE